MTEVADHTRCLIQSQYTIIGILGSVKTQTAYKLPHSPFILVSVKTQRTNYLTHPCTLGSATTQTAYKLPHSPLHLEVSYNTNSLQTTSLTLAPWGQLKHKQLTNYLTHPCTLGSVKTQTAYKLPHSPLHPGIS